ncbi:Hsp20/alpha crystallin family protein [Halobacteria archaeon AArc-curdl1]|uniref:Hsp20/alpha crystallin family protein n=1 Tax=Natronosalvus hydrolyticus TaxID=2979988 RepID=A0AAP2Z4M3_9EURY|nr:Hsp20/alpha crystallin family protein [Halobacteria archaeon AArc-curdl1]
MPRFETDDIEVRLTDTTVHVTAEREEEVTEWDEEFCLKSKRARRSLNRSIRLSEPVDESKVEQTYRNGLSRSPAEARAGRIRRTDDQHRIVDRRPRTYFDNRDSASIARRLILSDIVRIRRYYPANSLH